MQGSYVSWQWQMMQNLKRNWLVNSKLTWGIWRILTWALGNKVYNVRAKKITKYIIFELKKYRGVLLDGTKYWCNIWRKPDLCFQKWHEEFSQFSPEHIWKSEKWDFDGILLFKVENVWAQNLQVSFVSWQWKMIQNVKRNWLFSSKLTWGIWRSLTRELDNLKNLHFNGLLSNNVYNVWAKKNVLEFCLMALNIDATFEGKPTCVFKNDLRNLANLHQSSCSKV